MTKMILPLESLAVGPEKDCFTLIAEWSDGEQASLLSSLGVGVRLYTGVIPGSPGYTEVGIPGDLIGVIGVYLRTTVPVSYQPIGGSGADVTFRETVLPNRVGLNGNGGFPIDYKILVFYRRLS